MKRLPFLLALLSLFYGAPALGQDVHTWCNNGGSGFSAWSPCAGAGSSVPIYTKVSPMTSAGAQQNNLAVATNTQLTVPTGTLCALITVEVAQIRKTSDGTSASTTAGTLYNPGDTWSDCGPLASYKFTAVTGSPTLTAEYFK